MPSNAFPAPDLRRRRLVFSLPSGVVLASPFALAACGGGDDPAPAANPAAAADDPDRAAVDAVRDRLPALARTTQAVTVVLPAGSGVAVATTTVASANSLAAVDGDGRSRIVQIAGAPQMGYVLDAAGRVLLLGVVETGRRTTLDARSTAEALLLIASEAGLQGDAMALAVRRVLAQPSADAVVEPVRLAVASAAARGGIVADDPALITALAAGVRAMRAGAATAPAPRSLRNVRPLAVTPRPDEPQSGVSVEDGGDYNTVRMKNAFRRRAHVSVAQVAYINDDGRRVELTAPARAVAEFDLVPTTALSFDGLVAAAGDFLAELSEDIGFLGAYEAGSVTFTPVLSEPFTLAVQPLDPPAKVAIYRTRVVGPGNNAGLARTDAESAVLDRLWGETFRLDIALPFLRTFILPLLSEAAGAAAGPGGLRATEEVLLSAILDLDNIGYAQTLFPETVAALKNGDAAAMLTAFWDEFSGSNTWLKVVEIGMRATVSAAAGDSATIAAAQVQRLTNAFTKLARIVVVVRAAATVGDYLALLKDWAAASQLSSAEIFVSKAKVSISPRPLTAIAFAGAAGRVTVTAHVDDLDGTFPPENIFLAWKCTGRYGHLYKLGFDDVDKFTSSLASPSHSYIPTDVEPDPLYPDVITVTAFYQNPTTSDRAEMGTATATVEFRQKFNITLAAPTGDLAANTDAYLTAVIQENLPAGTTVEWTWTHGGVGTLDELPADTNLQDSGVVFHAGAAEGAATATVRAVVTVAASATAPAATYNLTPKTARMRVASGVRTETVNGGWTTETITFDNGSGGTGYSVLAYAIVPKVSGFTSCSVDIVCSDPYISKSRGFGPGVYVGTDPNQSVQDRGGVFYLGLSGASGTIGSDGSGPAGARAYFAGRFADLTLKAVYTLQDR